MIGGAALGITRDFCRKMIVTAAFDIIKTAESEAKHYWGAPICDHVLGVYTKPLV